MTAWHITLGTYGSRLHGGARPTVSRRANRRGDPFVPEHPGRERVHEELMTEERVTLCRDVCVWMESVIPEICDRGGWELLACAVAPDHVHCVLRVRNEVHGRDVRKWFKRWLSDALNERCGKRTWFAKGGSAKAIREPVYFRNAVRYVNDQRASVD